MHMIHKRLVFAVGAALVLAGLAWGAVGFYVEQAVWLVGLLAAGSLIMWLASRMPATTSDQRAPSPVRIERNSRDTGPRRPIGERMSATRFTTSTTKSFEEIRQLGRAIAEAAGGVANTVREADVVPDQRIVYRVRRLGVRTVLTFSVHVTRGDVPGRRVVDLRVGDYQTTQAKVLGLGVGPRTAPGYGSLRTFSDSLRALLDDDVPSAVPSGVPAAVPAAATAPDSAPAVVPGAQNRVRNGNGRRSWRGPAAVLGGAAVLAAGVATAIHLGRDDDATARTLPENSSAPTTGAPVAAAAGARLHPVLQLDPTVVDGCDGRDGPLLPNADRTVCFHLGPTIVELDERTSFSPVADGWPGVWVILPSDSAAAVAEYTADHFAAQMAVVVDDVVVSALTIHSEIADGRLFIEVADEQQEAQLLARLQGG